MSLSSRKEKILQAVVDSYIDSCEPISSLEIHDKYLPSLSSATIRNELASLEEMGYLVQPHVSSGRVPTAEGYRMYVEKLMPRKKLTRNELNIVKKYFGKKMKDIDDMVKSTAKVISEITNLTSVAYARNIHDDTLISVKIIKLTETLALFVIVTDRNIIKDTTINVSADLDEKYFELASRFATEAFAGHRISEIINTRQIVRSVHSEYENIFGMIIQILKTYSEDTEVGEFALEGSSKILDQPEYANLEKAKAMLSLLDAKEQLLPVLDSNRNMDLTIRIGRDNELGGGVPECAIVTASYSVGGVGVGKASVIGPMRMDYSKVVSVLDCIGKTLGRIGDDDFTGGDNE